MSVVWLSYLSVESLLVHQPLLVNMKGKGGLEVEELISKGRVERKGQGGL
jgi:hypothetical protein